MRHHATCHRKTPGTITSEHRAGLYRNPAAERKSYARAAWAAGFRKPADVAAFITAAGTACTADEATAALRAAGLTA